MTLDSHEIRLGNTYKIELGDGTYKSDLINLGDIENLLDDDLDDFYQAMEIDESWLIRLGFKPVSDRVYVKDYHYGYEFGITNHFVIKNGDHFIRYKHIKYVHQLENLYFALIGEELTYNC
jgi:hypothetical protein